MNRALVVGIVFCFVVLGAFMLGSEPQAKAGGWEGLYGYGYGGYGYGVGYAGDCCYGSYPHVSYRAGWDCCDVCRPWYSPYRWRLFPSWHRGWGWGRFGWTSAYGYDDCCGYTAGYGLGDCCGGDSGVIYEQQYGQPEPQVAPQTETAPQPQEAAPKQPALAPPNPEPASTDAKNSAFLNLRVPSDAAVFVNDHMTSSTGSARRYISRGLEPGMSYQFEVRAEVTRNGVTTSRTKVVQLQVSQSADLVLDFDTPQVVSLAR